jgi:hypothetical protein
VGKLSSPESIAVDLAIDRLWRGRIGPAKLFDEEFDEIEVLEQVAGAGKVERHDSMIARIEADTAFEFLP